MYLFGASGHGKVVAEIAEACGVEIEGFVDQNSKINKIFDYKVIHELPRNKIIFLSIGNNATRKRIKQENPEIQYLNIIHPSAMISSRAKIGEGTVVMAGVTINTEVKIGEQCIINTNASIDHECVIHSYVHISPNVALAGNVEVGEGTHIGIGASVLPNVKIGKWCVIGAGAVILKDVPDYAVMVGNPAKLKRFNEPSYF